MRIDKLLWFLRLAKTRSAAQTLVETELIRLNSRRVTRPAQEVRIGDILTLPLPRGVTVIEVIELPRRRGPASEAQSCYRLLDAAHENPIAAAAESTPEGTSIP